MFLEYHLTARADSNRAVAKRPANTQQCFSSPESHMTTSDEEEPQQQQQRNLPEIQKRFKGLRPGQQHPAARLALFCEEDVVQQAKEDTDDKQQLAETGEKTDRTSPTSSTVTNIASRNSRTKFTEYHREVLRDYFLFNQYPTDVEVAALARELQIGKRVVTVWFQNSRQKVKTKLRGISGPLPHDLDSVLNLKPAEHPCRECGVGMPTYLHLLEHLRSSACSAQSQSTTNVNNNDPHKTITDNPSVAIAINRLEASQTSQESQSGESQLNVLYENATKEDSPSNNADSALEESDVEDLRLDGDDDDDPDLDDECALEIVDDSISNAAQHKGVAPTTQMKDDQQDLADNSKDVSVSLNFKKDAMVGKGHSPSKLVNKIKNETNIKPGKRFRTKMSGDQLAVLEKAFQTVKFPKVHICEQLAKESDLSVKVVQIWFQNRRAKCKRKDFTETVSTEVNNSSNLEDVNTEEGKLSIKELIFLDKGMVTNRN